MTIEDRLTTLETLWSAWSRQGHAMTGEQWQQPTRLGSWQVRSLYAHAALWPLLLTGLTAQIRDIQPTHASAAALLRDFNAPEGVAHRQREWAATSARDDAAKYSTAELIERFEQAGPPALAAARELGPVPVDYFGQAILGLDEAVSIAIMEATVHLLDLQDALGQTPAVPGDALAHTRAVLAEMAPPVDFIEAATGRRPATVFPVLT